LTKKTMSLFLIVILFSLSLYVRWNGTGGGKTQIDFTDPRVKSALEFVAENDGGKYVITQETFLKAWLSPVDEGYQVNIGYSYYGHLWLTKVQFDAMGQPIGCTTHEWTGVTFANFLRILSVVLMGLWFAWIFVLPQFGVKCPECTTNPLLPVLMEKQETTIFPGGLDAQGRTLPPIIERSWICPRCGFAKVCYVIPESYRAEMVRSLADVSPSSIFMSPKEFDKIERLFEKWQEGRKKTVYFESIAEWKAFYNELKRREGEMRRPAIMVNRNNLKRSQ